MEVELDELTGKGSFFCFARWQILQLNEQSFFIYGTEATSFSRKICSLAFCSLTLIVFQAKRSYIKQKLATNIRQQEIDFVSWLTKIKLKPNERIESVIVPMCINGAYLLLGNLTWVFMEELIDIRKERELTIWSVAPMLMIQETAIQEPHSILERSA